MKRSRYSESQIIKILYKNSEFNSPKQLHPADLHDQSIYNVLKRNAMQGVIRLRPTHNLLFSALDRQSMICFLLFSHQDMIHFIGYADPFFSPRAQANVILIRVRRFIRSEIGSIHKK